MYKARTEQAQQKLAKAKAIADEIKNIAAIVAKNVRIAFPPKRLFRKKGKRPLKRLKRQKAMLALAVTPQMARARIMMLAAQPIPNYVPGGVIPSGVAIVGESGPELIITPNGTITTAIEHPRPNLQPPRPIRPVPGIDKEPDL